MWAVNIKDGIHVHFLNLSKGLYEAIIRTLLLGLYIDSMYVTIVV